MKTHVWAIVCVWIIGSAAAVNAAVWTDFDLIVLGDFNANGAAIDHKSLFGGDVNGSGGMEFGRNFSGSDVSTYVAGDINPGFNYRGSVRYAGSLNSPYTNNNGSGNLAFDANATTIAADIAAEVKALSADLASLSETAGASLEYVDNNMSTFRYAGSDATVVLNLSVADLTASTQLFLDLGAATTLIVNVTDTGAVALDATGLDASTFSSFGEGNVIWNFIDVSTLTTFRNQMKGAVIAPYATLNADGASEYDGTIVVDSIIGSQRQYHHFQFTGDIPDPSPIDLPIPTPAALPMGLALMGLAVARRRR